MAKKKAMVRSSNKPSKPVLWTAGHSIRSIEEFLTLLKAAEIEVLADVRRFPGSRRHPQFNQDALSASLAKVGIEYRHLPGLGGRRTARQPNSPNAAWRVESFNAYADHLQSPEFADALAELIDLARQQRTVIVCSEALPHKCHRRIIADVMVARGWQVRHLLSPTRIEDHQMTPFAHVDDMNVTYPQANLFE